MNDNNFNKLVGSINIYDFKAYLEKNSWVNIPFRRDNIKIFQKGDYQINLPMDRDFRDYDSAISRAVTTLSEEQGLPVSRTLMYLLHPNSDILRFRMKSEHSDEGYVLLDNAINMYSNAKKLLAASVRDIVSPAKVHIGRYEDYVNSFLNDCRFGQTEVGSYVISLICPLANISRSDGYQKLSNIADATDCETSLTRQATSNIMINSGEIVNHIMEGDFANFTEKEQGATISSNFYEALWGLNSNEEANEVDISADWCPTISRPDHVPGSIKIQKDCFKPIKEIAENIKNKNRGIDEVIGRIKSFDSNIDAEERKSGYIKVVYIDKKTDRAKTIKAKLSESDYYRAWDAHRSGAYIRLTGEFKGKQDSVFEAKSFQQISDEE